MKITAVIPRMCFLRRGLYVGGSTTIALSLCEELVQNGHRVRVVAGVPADVADMLDLDYDWCTQFVPLVIRSRSVLSYSTEFIAKAAGALMRSDPYHTIVHIHSGYAQYSVLSVAARIRGMRVLHSVYCPLSHEVADRKRAFLHPGIARTLMAFTHRFVAISENIRQSLEKAGIDPSKIETVPPVVSHRFFQAKPDREAICSTLGIPPGGALILFVGNVSASKGLDRLVEAMPTIIGAFPEAHFVITTEFKYSRWAENERQIVARIHELNVEDSVVNLNAVPDMPALMASADVLVAPFRDTAGPSDIPLPIIEAMACGCPAVATRVGAIPEIIEHGRTGVLIEGDHPNDLAERVIGLLDDNKVRMDMARNAAEAARRAFSPARGVGDLMRVYDSLAEV